MESSSIGENPPSDDVENTKDNGENLEIAKEMESNKEEGIGKESISRNTIQLSSTKRSLRFYVQLAMRMLHDDPDGRIHLSGLGFAIAVCVNLTEILREDGYVEIEKIETSSVTTPTMREGTTKAKILVTIRKTKDFEKKYDEWLEETEKKKKERALQKPVQHTKPTSGAKSPKSPPKQPKDHSKPDQPTDPDPDPS